MQRAASSGRMGPDYWSPSKSVVVIHAISPIGCHPCLGASLACAWRLRLDCASHWRPWPVSKERTSLAKIWWPSDEPPPTPPPANTSTNLISPLIIHLPNYGRLEIWA